MSDASHSTDIAIIGAGPVGLFAVFEAGMLGLKSHVIDALEMVGGQCSALSPEKPIFDIPAHPQIAGQDLIDQLAKQAEPFEPTYHLGQQVIKLEKRDDGRFTLETNTGTVIDAGAVVIAAGCGAFGRNKPPMDGLEDYEGSGGVQYYVKRRADFAGKNVVIAGGGDSAVDWALSLHDIAAKDVGRLFLFELGGVVAHFLALLRFFFVVLAFFLRLAWRLFCCSTVWASRRPCSSSVRCSISFCGIGSKSSLIQA